MWFVLLKVLFTVPPSKLRFKIDDMEHMIVFHHHIYIQAYVRVKWVCLGVLWDRTCCLILQSVWMMQGDDEILHITSRTNQVIISIQFCLRFTLGRYRVYAIYVPLDSLATQSNEHKLWLNLKHLELAFYLQQGLSLPVTFCHASQVYHQSFLVSDEPMPWCFCIAACLNDWAVGKWWKIIVHAWYHMVCIFVLFQHHPNFQGCWTWW